MWGKAIILENLKEKFPNKYFYGLDNSKDAIELAVKEDKKNPYMIANLSNLPFRDNSVSCILNILARLITQSFLEFLEKMDI